MSEPLITVFGGTGFLGRRVVNALAGQGWQVRVAARKPDLGIFSAERNRLQPFTANIQEEHSVAEAVSGASGVVNAVSLWVEKGDLTFDAVHVQGALRLARLSREAGAEHLVHVSGIGVDSRSPSAFIRARARGEEVVQEAFPSATVVRPSVMFACGESFLKVLDDVSRLPIVPLFGRGETRLQPAFVEDVAAAIARLVRDDAERGAVFELGGAGIYTYREALEAVCARRGRKRLFVPVPFPVWHGMSAAMGFLPNAPLTRDQVFLMERDNVVSGNCRTFADLDMEPRNMEEVLATC